MRVSPSHLLRQVNSQRLMQLLIHEGPLTRVELADRSELSKQTVNEIVQELADAGWVREGGRIVGRVGRSPVSYEFEPAAGFAVGIDLGATTLNGAITDLGGTILAEHSVEIDRRRGTRLLGQVETACRRLAADAAVAWDAVDTVAIGTPGVVDRAAGVVVASTNIPRLAGVPLRDDLAARLGVPIHVDNEVNMSVLGEQWQGHGRGRRDFLMFNVGTGVGMGIVLDGEIRRGARGASGELAFLPIGADPFDPASHGRGAYETAAGGIALLRRYVEGGGRAASVIEIFDAAAAGDELARAALDEQARLVAMGIAASASLLDPELVVLGGGIGSRVELLEPVHSWLARLMTAPVPVETSALGNRAALVGSVAAALKAAHQERFGSPLVVGSMPIPQPATSPSTATGS